MNQTLFRSKFLAAAVLIMFTVVLAGEGFAKAGGQEQTEFTKAFEAGKKLYEDGEHKEAVIKLHQALTLAKEKTEITEACFYLSLAYYGLGEPDSAQLYLKRLFEAEPGREINARLFPSGYIALFYRIKGDFAAQRPAKVEEKPKVEAKAEEKKPVAVPGKAEPEVKKKGKFPWLIVGGLVVVGAALYFLLGKKKDSGSTQGTISVVSTPTGAGVFLDGSDTGQTTPCTLNNISAGSHTVKLVKDGYADFQQNVTVVGGQTATVNAALTKNTITVTSPASGTTWRTGTTNDIRWQVASGALAEIRKQRAIFRASENMGDPPGQSDVIDKSSRRKQDSRRESTTSTADPRVAPLPGSVPQLNLSLDIVKLKIELYKGGTLHSQIIAETGNTGVYSWPVPASLTDGADYKIRVSCSTDSTIYGESGTFTITAGTIIINVPALGSVWTLGSTLDIQWTGTAIGNVKIDLFKGASSAGTIVADTPNDGTHGWTIPSGLTGGSDYKIRISIVSNPSVFGESGEFTITSGAITVTAPVSGTVWSKGNTYDIKWTGTAPGNVKIDLYRGTSLIQTIIADKANDGVHSWTIPAVLTNASDYKIRISIASNSSIFGESGAFTITITSGPIVVNEPTAGSIWGQGSTYDIKWASGVSGDVKIELFKGTSFVQTINGDTANDGVHSWTIPSTLADGSDYKIMISIVSSPNIFGESGFFTIGVSSYDFVIKWGSQGSGDGQFNGPRGIAVDGSGNVYVGDSGNHRIQKFTGSGVFITKWGSLGTGDGQFENPWGMTVDKTGFIYVIELSNCRIQKFTSAGAFMAKFGSGRGAGDSQFNDPRFLAVDASGNIYVSDQLNYRIQKFNSNGVFLTKWGSQGSGDGQFDAPQGIAVDASGDVYVAESNNSRIQKFNSNGVFLTKWGSQGSGDSQFNQLRGMAIDNSGCIYVADYFLNRVQKFNSSGTFIAKWGTGGTGDGQFSNPSGTAVDSSGNVYVIEISNNRVQKFRPRTAAPPQEVRAPGFFEMLTALASRSPRH